MTHSTSWLGMVALCISCGSNFVSTGEGTGGSTAQAGATSGGSSAQAGGNSGGSTSVAGAPSGGASGSTSVGGKPAGGASGSGGSAGAADCDTLKADYSATADKARGCDSGSTDECSTSSTLPTVGGCGCALLVNAKSPYTPLAQQKYQAIQDAKCAAGPICNVACIANTSAACTSVTTTAGTAYECTGTSGLAAN
jgi:hypothetical protein